MRWFVAPQSGWYWYGSEPGKGRGLGYDCTRIRLDLEETMTQPVMPEEARHNAHQDGIRRAVRTWTGGIFATFLTLAGPGLLAAFGAIRWTHGYWIAVGTMALGAFLTAAISYAMRRLVPPS